MSNMGKGRWYSKYICDKCGNEIPFIAKKGFVGIMHYCSKGQRDGNYKHDFDLCENCEMKFRKWLNTREMLTTKELLNTFPTYENI